MNDRVTFAEQYGSATGSSHLRHQTGPCDTDKLMAMAWADRGMASEIYRAKIANDPVEIRRLFDIWYGEVAQLSIRKRWTIVVPAETSDGKKVKATIFLPALLVREVSRRSLEHWLFDICHVCNGRKYRLLRDVLVERGANPEVAAIHGRDVLSDDLCPACQGTGKRPLYCPSSILPLVQAALERLEHRYHEAGREAIRRLSQTLQEPLQSNSPRVE